MFTVMAESVLSLINGCFVSSTSASTRIYEVAPFQLIKSLWPFYSSGKNVCSYAVCNLRDVLHIPKGLHNYANLKQRG